MDLPEFERRLRERLASRWDCRSPVGLPALEIEQGLAFLNSSIPSYYQRFLEICGADAGSLFREYHWTLDTRNARNRELQLTSQEFGIALPCGLFTFLDYLGDFFWCFALTEGQNPEVWMFDLVALKPTKRKCAEFILDWEQLE